MLTRQLLAFSRKQVLQAEVLDLNAVLTNTIEILATDPGEHSDPGESRQAVDSGAGGSGPLEQVIMNLVLNSRDSMPDGGKLILATANVTFDEDYARGRIRKSRRALMSR